MQIRPYPAWFLLASALALSAWRFYERPAAEFSFTPERPERWASLARLAPEELDHGLAHRYQGLAVLLDGSRDVGYLSERAESELWKAATMPGELDRLQRYYMAQCVLPPTILRVDGIHPRVIVDCATPEQARRVLKRTHLTEVHDFGGGLVLARPGP